MAKYGVKVTQTEFLQEFEQCRDIGIRMATPKAFKIPFSLHHLIHSRKRKVQGLHSSPKGLPQITDVSNAVSSPFTHGIMVFRG